MPAGMRWVASIKRSNTSWRAKYTSVLSVKTRVTSETPLRLSERISTSPGKPVIEVSIGTVMKRSTSVGGLPGASVATWTCTLVTSGKASTESLRTAMRPVNNKATLMTAISTRCCKDQRTMAPIITDPRPRSRTAGCAGC